MIRLTHNDWRIFRRLQRKHKVSTEFLRYNLENIQKFIWYETWPRIVIKRYAVRKRQRVFLVYYRLRRVLFDQSNRKLLKRMRQNVRQWSKRMVAYQKSHQGINEYVEEIVFETEKNDMEEKESHTLNTEDVSKQLKEQLKLLKHGRRQQPLVLNSKEADAIAVLPDKLRADIIQQNEDVCDKTANENDKPDDLNNKKLRAKPITQPTDISKIDDVRKKLKEQLENIKIQRNKSLTLDTNKSNAISFNENNQIANEGSPQTPKEWQINLESTPEKQITTQENTQPIKQLATDEKTEKSNTEDDILSINQQQNEKHKTGLNFLDMLMCKVAGGQTTTTTNTATTITTTTTTTTKQNEKLLKSPSSLSVLTQHTDVSMDSSDGFLGFEDCERIPGMLMTPIVPNSTKNNKNSVFVSESLNEYMRVNDLETNYSIDADKSVTKSKIFARNMEGLMTPKTKPPPFDMPVVPENLLKFRTVAERKQYLQKFSKNSRLSIINNEASIYRELQRRMRLQKVKSASQQMAQSVNSSMSFTRNGWNAATFINTEFNKYYYQVLDVDHGLHQVRLRGVRGNNEEFRKNPYISKVLKPSKECPQHCVDSKVWLDLKPINKSISTKKLNRNPLPSVFKPCPLSHKTIQKPLDDDTAALLLAGGSMAVVRMPTVELEVFPEQGKPLNEIAKRYLQYILPHHDISREWAEFSVSTLQQPHQTLKEVEQAAAKRFNPMDLRKSYTFVIPYLNDRNHILVRRVVDRSEKLDQSFEKCLEDRELVPKLDFTFRKDLDETNEVLQTCADVVSDMINTVAISCSENSFIKSDPDGICADRRVANTATAEKAKLEKSIGKPAIASSSCDADLGPVKKAAKKNSLLMELKRLNATIIDAAVKPGNDKKPCSKAYCSMGCICGSLSDDKPMREHCGKTKCMLQCTCKSLNQSRIMRLETDGRTITTEDAFMLRRKATARLARMEKEFTSTIVLTENETLLINETNNDKKRRCTKAPKRYEDFADTEDEQRKTSPKKATTASALTTIDNEKNLAVEVQELREPVYVENSVLEQLKHCTVNLVPLQDMENVAPWCMIHNLYKCFCKGHAVEGKPMIIEKEEVNTTTEHGESAPQWEMEYNTSVKAKYTFEKVEKRKKSRDYDGDDEEKEEEEDFGESDNVEEDNNWRPKHKKHKKKETKEKLPECLRPTVVEDSESEDSTNQSKSDEDVEESIEDEYFNDPITESARIEKLKPKRSLQEVRKRFYLSRLECCRRQIPIPRRMFLYCNRKRRLNVLKFIKTHENEQTRLLLNEHVMRSVYYHKTDTETQKKTENNLIKEKPEELNKSKLPPTNTVLPSTIATSTNMAVTDNTRRKYLMANEVVDLLEDEDDDQQQDNMDKNTHVGNNIEENTQLSSSTTKSCISLEHLLSEEVATNDSTSLLQNVNNAGVITVKNFATLSGLNNDNPLNTTANNDVADAGEADILKIPKISSCFSLNVKANTTNPSAVSASGQQNLDFTSATTVHSAAFAQSSNQQQQQQTQKELPHNSQYPVQSGGDANLKDGSLLGIDMNNENVKDVYNNVIKTMNTLVSKKMQDIDFALKRESHIIPAPNSDILCIMKWSNFLDAFCEGFAFIWQVKMKDVTYFVATIRKIMPMIVGAMGIVNITALKPDKMPLMGRMLLLKLRNEGTQRLAIVMQGKMSHWVVKGFLRSEPTMACNRPTPETHPSLTKKINVLCSLLVKQRQRDEKRKEKEREKERNEMHKLGIPSNILQMPSVRASQTPKIAQIMPTPRAAIPTPPARNLPQILNQTTPQPQKNSTQIYNLQPLQQSSPQVNNLLLLQQQNLPQIVNVPPQQQNSIQILHQQQLNSPQIPNLPALLQPPPPVVTQQQPTFTNVETEQNLTSATEKLLPQTITKSKENSRKRKSTIDFTTTTPNNLLKMDSYAKMNTNIEFRKVLQSDINEIHLPELHRKDHKWLVLDLHNDFSHIFVPEFRDLVSLDRIQKVIFFARQRNKIVKLQFFQNAPFDAFVTPKSGRKIYFGPLTMDMKPPTLILLQSVDGQMMLRELYQLQHGIKKPVEEKTKAFWLLQLNGQTHFEVDLKVDAKKQTEPEVVATSSRNEEVTLVENSEATKEKSKPQNELVNEDNDEDCMIIDESIENVVSTLTDPKECYNPTIESNNSLGGIIPQTILGPSPPHFQALNPLVSTLTNDPKERFNFTIKSMAIIPQTNSLPGPLPIQTLNSAKVNNTAADQPNTNTIKSLNTVTTQSVLQMPLQSAVTTTTLPILKLPPNTIITGIPPNPPSIENENLSTLPLNLPTNAVITGITPAPPGASYGSTIFLSSSSSGTTSSISTSNVAVSSVNPTASKLNTTNKTNIKPLAQIMPEVKLLKPAEPKATNKNPNYDGAAIKRRRISLFCSNKFDKMSENIAVDAVINKILPQNTEDVQINPLTSVNAGSIQPKELVSTIGSTTITKMCDTYPVEDINKPVNMPKLSSTATGNSKLPIVFDVNFMDDGDDEPTASIVIKPSSTTTKTTPVVSTVTSQNTSSKNSNNSSTGYKMTKSCTMPLTQSSSTSTYTIASKMIKMPSVLTTTQTGSTSTCTIASKLIKIPTTMTTSQNSKTSAYTVSSQVLSPISTTQTSRTSTCTTPTTTVGSTKLLHKLLCAKSPNIKPAFSTTLPTNTTSLKPLLPSPSNSNTTTSSRPSFPSSSNSNSITSRLSLPSSSNSSTTWPATSAAPLKLNKTMSFSSAMIKTQSAATTATKTPTIKSTSTTTNQQHTAAPATVTIKQVQDMLTKQTIDLTSSSKSSPSTLTIQQVQDMIPKPTIDLTTDQSQSSNKKQPLPTIKATITPANVTTTTAPTSSSITASSTTTTSTSASSSSSNKNSTSTLTISKVESFGSPSKKTNDRTTSQTLDPSQEPQPTPIHNNNDRLPNPPEHIQYGYIVSSAHAAHKFVAKRVAKEFYVKVPLVGIVKLQALAVNNYLNKYMSKNFKEPQSASNWHFVAASKDVQLQNHQKSLLVRKTKPSTSANPNKVVNVSSTDEPILIDD